MMQIDDSERLKLGFEMVRDLSTLLITLATGMIAITIASAERGVLRHVTRRARVAALAGWGLCLVSAVAGILQIMVLTGQLLPVDGGDVAVSSVRGLARGCGIAQLFTFVLGVMALIYFAFHAVIRTRPASDAAGEARQQVPVFRIAPDPEGKPSAQRRRHGRRARQH